MSITEIEAAIAQLPPEEVAQLKQRLTQVEAKSTGEQDPLLRLLGMVDTDVQDVAERHDDYLGQALLLGALHGR